MAGKYKEIIKSLIRPPKGTLKASPVAPKMPPLPAGDLHNAVDKRSAIKDLPEGSKVSWQGKKFEVFSPPPRSDLKTGGYSKELVDKYWEARRKKPPAKTLRAVPE